MELGTGVFLSGLFLGTVALFIATKDRWNWKKIFLWPLAVAVVLSLVGGIVAYAYKQYEEYEERPKVLSEFQGIRLGEKFQDAIFKHGNAVREEAQDVEAFTKYLVEHESKRGTPYFEKVVEANKKAKDALAAAIAKSTTDGAYILNNERVGVKGNQIENVSHLCNRDSLIPKEANGIRCGDTGDEILKKFGGAVRILCPKNRGKDSTHFDPDAYLHNAQQPAEMWISSKPTSLNRRYDVAKYGTVYFLTQNKVFQISIAEPAAINSYVGINWDKCS